MYNLQYTLYILLNSSVRIFFGVVQDMKDEADCQAYSLKKKNTSKAFYFRELRSYYDMMGYCPN